MESMDVQLQFPDFLRCQSSDHSLIGNGSPSLIPPFGFNGDLSTNQSPLFAVDHDLNGYHGFGPIGSRSPSNHPAAGYVSPRFDDSRDTSSITCLRPVFPSSTFSQIQFQSPNTTAITTNCPIDDSLSFNANATRNCKRRAAPITSESDRQGIPNPPREFANSHGRIPMVVGDPDVSGTLGLSSPIAKSQRFESYSPTMTRSLWDSHGIPWCPSPSFTCLSGDMAMRLPSPTPLAPMSSPMKKSAFWVSEVEEDEGDSDLNSVAVDQKSYVDGERPDGALNAETVPCPVALPSLVSMSMPIPIPITVPMPILPPLVDLLPQSDKSFAECTQSQNTEEKEMEEGKQEEVLIENEKSMDSKVKEEKVEEEKEVQHEEGNEMEVDVVEEQEVVVKVECEAVTGGNLDVVDKEDDDVNIEEKQNINLRPTVSATSIPSKRAVPRRSIRNGKRPRRQCKIETVSISKIKGHPQKKKRRHSMKKRLKKESKIPTRRRRSRYDDGVPAECTKTTKVDFKLIIEQTVCSRKCHQQFLEHEQAGNVTVTDTVNECRIDECSITPKNFLSKCHLTRHAAEVHFDRRYRCRADGDQCSAEFRQRSQCIEHIRNIHLRSKKPWRCYLCNCTFTRWGGVSRHLALKRCQKMKEGNMSTVEVDDIVRLASDGKEEMKARCRN